MNKQTPHPSTEEVVKTPVSHTRNNPILNEDDEILQKKKKKPVGSFVSSELQMKELEQQEKHLAELKKLDDLTAKLEIKSRYGNSTTSMFLALKPR